MQAVLKGASPVVIGILCAIGAAIAFSLNDVGIKFLSGDYALHQIVMIRAMVAISFTLGVFVPLEGGYSNLVTRRLPMHLLRGLFVVAANMMFFLGLAAMPLSEATAIFFVSPLVITLFSVIFLGERVGPWRWLAVAVGLFGALVILRPGTEAFNHASLFPLGAAICYAALHILTRKMGSTERASTLAFYIQIVFILVSAGIGLSIGDGRLAGSGDPSLEFLLRAWTMPNLPDLAIIASVGVASGMGGYLISQAYRLCEAAVIAPFEYVALLMAITFGIIVFGEWPDFWSWCGIFLIFTSGFLVFWREAALNRKIASERPMPRQR